ncbi:hypothetical protein CVT26_008565 [Gymnopilus dilepis]|uniref:Calcium uniporter protein, mitochondrial n=1 Tax=Gymnopilus dilepis TaxID=231916 RepID=A0A409XXP2_9AGAR|nr:hypothetical protein CVT26_008565 [Gymnopilus dilepis]
MHRLFTSFRLNIYTWPSRHILCRPYSAQSRSSLNVSHSQFLAEASPQTKWRDEQPGDGSQKTGNISEEDELYGVTNTRAWTTLNNCLLAGKLSPTSSHLFKLILPLASISHPYRKSTKDPSTQVNPNSDEADPNAPPSTPPTVLLLHPSQPLSHVSRLILASLAPATPSISFRSISPRSGRTFQWSDSTDFGDFVKDAARSAEFKICISYGPESESYKHVTSHDAQEEARGVPVPSESEANATPEEHDRAKEERMEKFITVSVPTFADRTRFLRHRLNLVESRLRDMEGLKALCDAEAHRGARKMALGGLGTLVVYWAAVARLTFWDFGWDIMEPITYLSGLSMVILGYLWFLYQGREVSYTSVLARSISSRREALYKTRGFDIERWIELVNERKALRAEIARIAQDYEGDDKDVSKITSAVEGEGIPASKNTVGQPEEDDGEEEDALRTGPGSVDEAAEKLVMKNNGKRMKDGKKGN